MSEKPIHTIRIGAVKASIWENKGAEGKTFHTTSVVRCYKDENDQWRESASYLPDELPKVELAVRKAFEFIQLDVQEKREATSFQQKVTDERSLKQKVPKAVGKVS